ncbi:ATP-binding protein [Streptomyces abyssomicinicus]|uniref:ATP-binding protein n=1 Tax=Streptomyces abyssomicinicus TaxID=574929 RepID=UPI001584203A|nr:ATP-binding protein [Streptomyces abyssomicinicus]
MDPNSRGPEERGHGGSGRPPRPRAPRDPLTPDFGQHAPSVARTTEVFTDDLLLTVNPVDGSEIELCPPERTPAPPAKLTLEQRAEADRAAARAAAPAADTSASLPSLPLLERQEEREELVRLLARGRSARLVGPSGSGRSRLLDIVAEDCADLAPDGVIRLSGLGRSCDELLHDLLHAAYDAPRRRPGDDELHDLLGRIGAVVVVDDLAFGGADLVRLLDATPECAFLISATPDVPEPAAEALVETVTLTGLTRASGLRLLGHAVGRSLTEEETTWAGDLWFESEGLPLRFVQAGALLRQRDRLRAATDVVDEVGVFQDAVPVPDTDTPFDTREEAAPLPSLAEGAAPAPLLASRLSASARDALRFAVALGGELPQPAHLPALVGDTHADGALGELLGCALVSPAGGRHRLAAGVPAQLEAAGYADDAEQRVRTAAEHYAWWTGHQSVTPERVRAEADAILAVLAALPPADGGLALRLARNAAPAFAAGLAWSAWERALRAGSEAARLVGEVSEQGYFHHELGVLALCQGRYERARAELDAAVALRAAAADKRGQVAGRRALALVADRTGDLPGMDLATPSPETSAAAASAGAALTAFGAFEAFGSGDTEQYPPKDATGPAQDGGTVFVGDAPVTRRPEPAGRARGLVGGARKNLVAAGAGALLVAVLGTVVTLGATGGDQDVPTEGTGPNPTASQGYGDELGADEATGDGDDTGTATSRPTDPGPDGVLGTPDDPANPSGDPGPTDEDDEDEESGPTGGSTTKPPATTKPTKPSGGSGSPSGSGGSTTSGSPSGGSDAGTSTGTTTGGTPTTGGTTTGGTTDGTTEGGTTEGSTDGGATDGGADGGATDGADGGTTTTTTTAGGVQVPPSLTSPPGPDPSQTPALA